MTLTPHIVITRQFELFDNHLDGMARCVLGFTTHHLSNFFAEDGFAQNIVRDRKGKKLIDMAKDLVHAENAREAALTQASTIDTTILAKPTAQRKKEVIAKARVAAERKKVERGQKRKIKLTT